MIGHIIGNYKITEKVGEGGMGAVFKGVDLMLEREVAIKALRPEFARQPHIVERFRTEAVTLAKLNHPHIATLYNFFRQGDDLFMVMEFVQGETLDNVIKKFGLMPYERAIPLFCQALEGIDHAHKLGIVHRDIKPGNMMLTGVGSIKVMDFGIARMLGTARMTRAGYLIGTLEYMSPEQIRGQETDARSDIYSLGILLYELLTGRVPFASDSEYELMRSQIEDAPAPLRDFIPHVPERIESALLRALAKEPEARFQTAGEFRAALENSLRQVGLTEKDPVQPVYEQRPVALFNKLSWKHYTWATAVLVSLLFGLSGPRNKPVTTQPLTVSQLAPMLTNTSAPSVERSTPAVPNSTVMQPISVPDVTPGDKQTRIGKLTPIENDKPLRPRQAHRKKSTESPAPSANSPSQEATTPLPPVAQPADPTVTSPPQSITTPPPQVAQLPEEHKSVPAEEDNHQKEKKGGKLGFFKKMGGIKKAVKRIESLAH